MEIQKAQGEHQVKNEADPEVTRNAGNNQKQEKKKKDLLRVPSEGAWPWQHLGFRLVAVSL